MDATLLPKVQIDVVVGTIPVESVIETAKKLCTQVISVMVRSLSMMSQR